MHRNSAAVAATLTLGVGSLLFVTGATAIPAHASAPRADGAHQYGRSLFAVDGVTSDDVWAVGLTPRDDALIEHWDGAGWTRLDNPQAPEPAAFKGVDAHGADDVWAVGSHAPGAGLSVTYVQHWNGTRWRVVQADPGFAISQAKAVDARAADDAWLVGDAQKTAAGNLVALTEHWDGNGWTKVAGARIGHGCDVSLADVAAVAPDNVWAVGTKICESSTALVEHWDGQRWSRVKVPSPRRATSVGLEGVTAISADNAWAVGSSSHGLRPGRNHVLHWDGTRWSRVPAPSPGPATCGHFLSAVTGSAADDVWAAGSRSCGSSVTPEMLHWDGTDWTKTPFPNTGFDDPPGDGLYGVVAPSKRSAFAVGIAKTGGASVEVGFIERWNGRLWSLQ